jgi:glutamate N-acetyltransferase/amino-acid N-acetyltransferase
MAVGLKPLSTLHPVPGIRWGIGSAGIKKPGKRDVTVMEIAPEAVCAAVFTRNAFCAAPVIVAREHLDAAAPRWLLINTGNANAGTGERGLADARTCCAALAELAKSTPQQVLPFSTGVIGEPLPVAKIVAALPQAMHSLDANAWVAAAEGIMTTDTAPKGASVRFNLGSSRITVTGIAKGAGMIRPDMATMLAYIATDASISQSLLQRCLQESVDSSFNSITVDGDTSTNDACVLIATRRAGNAPIGSPGADYEALRDAVRAVCEQLAQMIVRDGEGATKFITVDVANGTSVAECRDVAYAIAHSPLVKTAFFASDPNWGRILAAVGRAGVPNLDLAKLTVHLGDVCIVRNGGRAPEYQEQHGQRVMNESDIVIRVDLNRGAHRARVWTCDFSYDYVKINAEYRT